MQTMSMPAVLAAALASAASVHAAEAPERSALFGDLHIHTMYSFDAFMGSVRTTPDHAYRFAKGEAIPIQERAWSSSIWYGPEER